MIVKDQINIIEEYTTYKNLYKFLTNQGELIYKCDLCKCKIKNITKKNKILYTINGIDNNILSNITNPLINSFDNLNLEELFVINNITHYNVKYKKCNLIFCNLCLYYVNKKTFKFKLFPYDYLLFDYITYDFYNYILMNNMYFIKDKVINDKNVSIERIVFDKINDEFFMKFIFINNLSELKIDLLKKKNYNTLNDIIMKDFNFDIEYLKEYLKIKYD